MKKMIAATLMALLCIPLANASTASTQLDCKPVDSNGWFKASISSMKGDSPTQLADITIEADGIYKVASLICQFDSCGGIVNGAVTVVGKIIRDRNDRKVVGLVLKSARTTAHDPFSGRFSCR